ncbi:AAA family ATPase [Altericroceibacterium endophyticum]|uniref:AAA family ATPase n=1 Tax=Altericroceibacterium endophyticum TaxID=1808508 RepID=A0A6I4T4L5_9SPHN|nr:AAA family ATPase [Altericroceibacterium endophyticum]MXO64575.1 AAA family ATPase [Altericroceibacterium endophyticum]
MDRFFIVTGGPGSGKSTLLAALAEQGLPHLPEARRAVIRDEVAAGGTALPWDDRDAFAERMLTHDLNSYEEAQTKDGILLFDRGIPDIIGYRTLCGLGIPADLTRAAESNRYNRHVFIAPPWAQIYAQDTERKQDWDEAVATHYIMGRVYQELGYILVPLPLVSPDERATFVQHWIAKLKT